MDETQGFSRFTRNDETEAAPGLSPIKAFLLLGTLFAVVAGGLALTKPDAAPIPSAAPRQPNFSLTDAEAIDHFKALNRQLILAYRERDIALAESLFTSDSPMLPRVRKEITELIDSEVLSTTKFKPESTEIVSNTPDEVSLQRVEVLYPGFESETGRDVSSSQVPERETVRWTLRLEMSDWLLHEAVVMKRETVRGRG